MAEPVPAKADITFIVAIDGSENSHKCFDVALALKNSAKHVHLMILHVADPEKTYLPWDLKPDAIRLKYESELLPRFPKAEFSIKLRDKGEDETTKEAVCTFVNKLEGNKVLFCGQVGRKGPKANPSMLGSMADFSLREAHCASVIVKSSSIVPDVGKTPSTFVLAVDASKGSIAAFHLVVELASPKQDRITVLHVEDDEGSDTEELKSRFEGLIRDHFEGNGEFVAVECESSVGKTVCQYIRHHCPDFLVVGADGMSSHMEKKKSTHLGSISDFCVNNAKSSVIVTELLTSE